MYLKGYQIKYDNDKILTLPKWDFGVDRSDTNKVWNGILSKLRSLSNNSYPMFILDLDNANHEILKVGYKQEFEDWMKKCF